MYLINELIVFIVSVYFRKKAIMKKTILTFISLIWALCFFCSCSSDNTPTDIEKLLQDKETVTVIGNEATSEQTVLNDEFVSVWPDELPKNETSEMFPDSGRPIQFWIEIEPGVWTVYYDYTSMYLYDFPDPEPYFHNFGKSFLDEKKIIIFKYDKIKTSEDGIDEKDAISKDDFDLFIDNLILAGYTDNSERTETTYYCEKYGVGITIVLTNEFPFVEDDPKLHPYVTAVDCCYVRLQLIDPDYVMDLEQIKAEEYQKWLEKQ